MRLIDADELIGKLKAHKDFFVSAWGSFSDMPFPDKSRVDELDSCIAEVVNAPTVEPCYQTTSCLDCKNYDKENYYCPRFCEVIRSAIEERPQGEWIVDKDNIFENFRKCSNCNEGAEWLDGGSQFLSNFCPNCGADMRGKEE